MEDIFRACLKHLFYLSRIPAEVIQILVDKIVLYIAPKLIGGQHAPTFLEGTGTEKLKDAVELSNVNLTQVGKDFKFVGYPIYAV